MINIDIDIKRILATPDFNLKEFLLALEKEFVERALEAKGNVKSHACVLLGMHRTTLVETCRRHGLLKKR